MTAAAVDLISQAQAVCRQQIADAKKATEGPWDALPGNWVGARDDGEQIADCFESAANAAHIANHSPDKVIPWWEWALEQLGEYDEEARWTPDGMDRNSRAVSLATAIAGSHE